MIDNAVLEIKRLSHRYTTQWALHDVSFKIPGKGIYGLLGSNGAGKSTLLNIICGVIKPTNGEVFIHDLDVFKDPIQAKRYIGFLPQKLPLYEELTVEEYLHHAADLRYISDSKIKDAINNVLELCAIEHFRKRLIRNLSGGYKQRVGIAQAIIHEPNIVVLDEPTNGLDPNQIIEIRRLIQKISEDRVVILSSHILREIHAICEQILMIEQGKLVFSGSIEEFDNYIVPEAILVSFATPLDINVLKSIKGVNRVEKIAETRFRVFFSDSFDVMSQIVENSARYKWHLSEMKLERSSWNDIFSELSSKNIVNR